MTTLVPGASYKPVQNHGGPMSSHLGLVLHVQVGDGSLYGWFNNPAANASSHLWVAKTGAVEQYVDMDLESWAQEGGNMTYNSVETEGLPTEPLTSAQIESLGKIMAWGHSSYGWPLAACDHGGRGLTTHAHYPSGTPDVTWGGHPCPGSIRESEVPQILAHAGTVPPPPPTPPPPTIPHLHVDYFSTTHNATCSDVKVWQTKMIQRGWNLGPTGADGVYGSKYSKPACEAFQTEKHLHIDGAVGPQTWNATWLLPVT
jgi:hypothetical protein